MNPVVARIQQLAFAQSCVRRDHRKRDCKSRPLPFACAPGLDSAAMHFYQISHNCQSETEAPVLPADAAVCLAKPIEDVRQELGRDADAGIAHFDLNMPVGTPEPDV